MEKQNCEKEIKLKRGDIVLELLYQVYENGSTHQETGFGSFIENVAIRILELVDDGIITKKGEQKINPKIFEIEQPVPKPSVSISESDN